MTRLRFSTRQLRWLAVLLGIAVLSAPACVGQRKGSRQTPELDRDYLIRQLEQRLLLQQQMLDEAIQEVVRAKAKLRGLETRADAASELAEAEIAVKSFRTRVAGDEPPELARAQQLLKLANEEFEKQNFGGALYLTGQAKSQISAGMRGLSEREQFELLRGETPFAVPLSLTVKTRSNLREGPGEDFRVLATLEEGVHVTGYSVKGSWLRVKRRDGTSGWIHQSLVDAG